MKKPHLTTGGFTAVEFLLVVVTLAIIGVAGYFVAKHVDKKTTTSPTTTTSTGTTTKTTTSTTTKKTTPTDAAVVLQRQQYIDNYVTANTSQNYTAAYYSTLFNGGYITSSLNATIQSQASHYTTGPAYTANPAYDGIICINVTPSSYTYGTVSVNSSATTATLPVNVYVSGSSTPTPFTANWVKTSGVWQLNGSACSQP